MSITRKITTNAKKFQKDVRVQIGVALAAAFAFIIAFSWNEFVKEAVTELVSMFGLQNAILLKLVAAIFATVIGVIGISYFAKWGK
jgi:uncharacterized membrane protein YccC